MRWIVLAPLVAIASAATFGVTDPGPLPGEIPHYLLTDREAFVPGAAQLVATPPIRMAEWSADGRYVLAVREENPPSLPIAGMPTGELGLILWNRQTGRAQQIWKRPPGPQQVEQLAWMPGTHTALMVVASIRPNARKSANQRALFWVDPPHRRAVRLRELAGEKLLISPRQPFATLMDGGHERLRVIKADGSMGPSVRLKGVVPDLTVWSPDGRALYWCRLEPEQRNEPAPNFQWLATQLPTGVVTILSPQLEREPQGYQENALPVQLRPDARAVPEGGPAQRVTLLWLESAVKSEQPRCLVSANSEGGSLAPDASAVLYLAQGAAWVAPITRLPRDQMLARVTTMQRGFAVWRARKIAHSLSLYIQDYDGAYPPMGDTAIDAIRPYLDRDDAIYPPGADESDFVYRYTGGPLKSLRAPTTTVLGYLPGPGGRAVIYADRHVEWRAGASGEPHTDASAGPRPFQPPPLPPRSRSSALRTLPAAHVPYHPFRYPGGSN